MTSASLPAPGLGFMQKLSPNVFLLYSEAAFAPADEPALVILFGWMGAGEALLAKYAHQHQTLFPYSAILLVRTSLATMNSRRVCLRKARPAATAAHAILTADQHQHRHQHMGAPRPRLLVHVFSAAGSCMLASLADAYAEPLPLRVSIFDSTPTTFAYDKLVGGVLAGLPARSWTRAVMVPLAHLFVAWWWVGIQLALWTDHVGAQAAEHNDAARVREARRVYLYSHADRVLPSRDVEAHATAAEAAGFHVRRELFDGTDHVAHARAYPDRYWRVVRDTWDVATTAQP
ncbi:hypothetical protein GQ53DRAFT_853654 [Thozetella sp. PMI_491]|nr:hypothetical protein GQ53DRAFT_853654 [Thozetella sp. PMI_491]